MFSGKALFSAIVAVGGEMTNQLLNPEFDGFNVSQIVTAGVLGAAGLKERSSWQPNLLSNKDKLKHEVAKQWLYSRAIGSLGEDGCRCVQKLVKLFSWRLVQHWFTQGLRILSAVRRLRLVDVQVVKDGLLLAMHPSNLR